MTTILLADDHQLVRQGLRALLAAEPDYTVVGEAANGLEVAPLVEELQPDVLIIDLMMPGLNGLEVTRRISQRAPETRIIILSMHADEEYVRQALHRGAAGYLLKDAGTAELELAVKAVARGETYLSPAVSKQVVADYVRRSNGEPNVLERLTPRQREVLRFISEGTTTQQIARQLNLSTKTVETHRAQLMERLGIHDVAGLVRFAIRMGLVTPNE